MLLNNCIDCGCDFFVEDNEASWKRRCLNCFKRHAAERDSGIAVAQRTSAQQWQEVAAQAKANLEAALEANKQLRHELEKERGRPLTAIDKTRLRQLIQLCHPDKHGGSPLASEVTQWLNKLRS